MESKTYTVCNTEKDINNFYKTYTECKDCNRTKGLKRYYENKVKISNQQKIYFEKNRGRRILQQQNNICIQIRGLVISYVQLENNLKALEEKMKINDSENN